MDNYNYPMGADTPDAPWNRIEDEDLYHPELEIAVICSNTLSKSVDSVSTTDYRIVDMDRETKEVYEADFDDTDLAKAYKDSSYYTATEALKMATEFAMHIISLHPDINDPIRKEAVKVFNACEGWEEDEVEFTKDF